MPRIPKIFQKSWFNLLILLIITVGLTVFWNEIDQLPLGFEYKLYQEVNKDAVIRLPEGVEIVEEDGVKILKDANNKIQIKLDNDWKIATPSNFVDIIVDDSVPSGELVSSFSIYKNKLTSGVLEKEVVEWLRFNNEDCKNCYKLIEYQNIGDIRIAKIEDVVALGDLYDFIFIKNGYLYDISTSNIVNIELIFNKLDFI